MISVLRVLRPYLGRHRRALTLAGLAMIGEVLAGLASPWPLKYIFDSVLFEHTRGGQRGLRTSLSGHTLVFLVALLAASVVIALLNGICSYVDDRNTDVVGQEAIYDLRRALFSHLQRLTISFHHGQDTRVGDLLSRLSSDIQSLQNLAAAGVSNLVTNGLSIVIMVAIMYWVDWRLATLVLVMTIPVYVVARRTIVDMKTALKQARKQEGSVSAVLHEALTSVRLTQAFGREDYESRRLDQESRKSLAANLNAAKLQSRLIPSMSVLSAISVAVVTGYGVSLAVSRSITPGDLLVFISYLAGLQSPIRQLLKLSYAIGRASAGVERIRETFTHEPLHEVPGAPEIGSVAGRVHFEDVTFGYEENIPVIRGVTLDADPGQVIAIVGPTGAGKSTIVSLLPRFYDPWKGRVLIDGTDIREVSLSSLRSQIALVLQDSLIFRATIRENIAFGRPDATNEEIEEAAEAAGVTAMVRRFEDGFDTVVSEGGTSLSGGQKQCIALARAILKNAPIVVLDEPTSSMDSLTEHLVMDGFARLAAGRTTFVIAHRLSTVRNADVVVVLDNGEIVELGQPANLLSRTTTRFARYASTQALVLGRDEGQLSG